MKTALKTLACITAGLVVGVAIKREHRKNLKQVQIKILDLPQFKKVISEMEQKLEVLQS